uniref:Uncharacterized protein n=1 Tax=Melanopsichium pennsylvanicum 4 TaxID=1398559 RepID=A0A077R5V3_9BASI|nr:uncharacterized protein BN887_00899 [Melanopsichium pennsylvanicum 4]
MHSTQIHCGRARIQRGLPGQAKLIRNWKRSAPEAERALSLWLSAPGIPYAALSATAEEVDSKPLAAGQVEHEQDSAAVRLLCHMRINLKRPRFKVFIDEELSNGLYAQCIWAEKVVYPKLSTALTRLRCRDGYIEAGASSSSCLNNEASATVWLYASQQDGSVSLAPLVYNS